jgi:hypothetical protein
VDGSGWATLGICVPIIVGLIGAWVKARTDAAGFKLSYEREKERGDRQDDLKRDSRLATDIATKMVQGLYELMNKQGGGQ